MSAYPNRPGFNAGSDTSAQAAGSLDDATLTRLRLDVYNAVRKQRQRGATCDEIEEMLGLRHQTASARLRELFLADWVFTTDECRPTRSGRNAHVYRIKQRAAP